MPVRDSTEWKHAIIEKKVINRDEGGYGRVTEAGTHYVMCAWDDCTNDGLEVHKAVDHQSKTGERNMHYVFCSERHKAYWLEAITPGRYGKLPKGMRLGIM